MRTRDLDDVFVPFPLRVLLVEPDAAVRTELAGIFRRMNMLVICADVDVCSWAIERCKSFHPEIAVFSSRLPASLCLDAAEEMRRMIPRLRVLLLTSSDRRPLEEQLKRVFAGAADAACAPLLLGSDVAAQQNEIIFYEPRRVPNKAPPKAKAGAARRRRS